MMLCDAVSRLFWGVCKKGAVHLGFFLQEAPRVIVVFVVNRGFLSLPLFEMFY